MPVFARSDVLCTTVSRAHGGCGEVHRRPLVGGAPAKVWRLDCPLCQGHLARDPLWSGNEASIPATPDEDRAVENSNTLFSRNRDDIMTMALARLAGLPEGMLLNSDAAQMARQALVKCAEGHDNFPGTKFCGECGTSLDSGQAVSVITDAPEKPARQPRQPKPPRQPGLQKMPAPAPRPASLEEELLSAPSI